MKITFKLALASAFVFASCGRKSGDKGSSSSNPAPSILKIEKSIEQASPSAQHFTIQADKGENIKTPSGAQIIIEASSFQHKDGNPVTGKVDVAFTEINTVAEIISSGIPMMAMNGNEMGSFVSDGMFKISASAGGEEVELASGKSVQVFTPARDIKSDFKYWYFDEAKGKWNDIGKRESAVNQQQISQACLNHGVSENEGITLFNLRWRKAHLDVFQFASIQQQETLQPGKMIPGKYDPKKAIIDIDFDKTNYPDLAPYNRLMWQYAGNKDDMDPEKNTWIYQSVWSDVSLKQSPENINLFYLSFVTNGRRFSTLVRPVVNGKDLEKAQAAMQQELKNIQTMQEKAEKEGASQALISQNLYNAFQVAKLGIYNCDRFYSDKNARSFTLNFKVGETIIPNQTYYILMDNKKSVLQFSVGRAANINPAVIDAVFLVAANGTLAALGHEELYRVKDSDGGSFALTMRKLKTKIMGLATLNEALNEL